MVATVPPKPDPAPSAVRAHHAAVIDWAYGYELWSHGRRYWCWVPVHYARSCTDEGGRHT